MPEVPGTGRSAGAVAERIAVPAHRLEAQQVRVRREEFGAQSIRVT
jgi:hypothetical protein